MPERLRRAVTALVAGAMLAAAGCGGSDAPSPPAEPSAGGWRTWVAAADLRVSPPPPPGSPAAQAELAEMRAAGDRLSASQERSIRFWNRDPAVSPWIEKTMELVAGRLTQKDPIAASRAYGLVSVAMYDAAVAAARAKYHYRRPAPEPGDDAIVAPGPDPCYPSEHAAIAGAASRVLAYVFPEQPAPRFDAMADEAAESRVLAGANFRSDVDAGLALGRAVATRVIARAAADGFDRRWDRRRPRGRRYWEPPPDTVTVPVRPTGGRIRTWVLRSGAELRPPPPPRPGSARFRAETREVLEISRRLTPEQRRIAQIWSAGEGTALPPGLWNRVTLALVDRRGMSTARAARAFALLNVALADAGVAAWDAKYAYWSPRPENVIRDLGLDRRWKPLLETPSFPSYVSGHSTFSAAAAEVLAHLFPERAGQFRAKAEEAGRSRIYGGIHFASDNVEGLRLGRQIGRRAVERARSDGAER